MKGCAESFAITLGGGPNDHAQRFLELEAIVLDPPENVLIKLVGSGGLHPTVTLTYLDILALLPDETQRAVTSYGHLLGAGDFALWLEGAPHRDIRPHATIYVERSAPMLSLEQFGAGHILIAPMMAGPADGEMLSRDWETCLSLISQHVEVALVLGRVLNPNDLREMLLIDSYAFDQLFAALAPVAASMPHDRVSATQLDLAFEERTNRAN
jgi:hypothetical protein